MLRSSGKVGEDTMSIELVEELSSRRKVGGVVGPPNRGTSAPRSFLPQRNRVSRIGAEDGTDCFLTGPATMEVSS